MLCYDGKLSFFCFIFTGLIAVLSEILLRLEFDIFQIYFNNIWLMHLFQYGFLNILLLLVFYGFSYQVAVRAVFLGYGFGIGIILFFVAPPSWQMFGIYVTVLATFHYTEFLSIAWINPSSLSIDSFILNHSIAYGVAACCSWIEFIIERLYFPGMKEASFISYFGLILCICGEFLSKNLTENDFQHNIDNKSMFDQEYNDRKYNRNKSLNNATINQRPSFGFFYQTDIYDHKQMEYDNGFYANRIPEINTQSNNLFTHPFMNFNKKRSFSEADVIKSNRSNPFMHYRRNTQIHNDFYNKSVRPISDPCIDPRMFYKNMPINTMKNKENHAKPAFSYAQIITRALNGSQDGKLTLGEIYKWIEDNFEYYKYANPVWKNSIRHNLSLSKCFKKVAREPGTRGKGGKWMIDEEFIAQEENRKKRKTFEEENLMNHHSYGLNSEDPRYYQM